MSTLTIYTDGGARGNPGPAAIGVVMQSNDWNHEISKYIGEATNNVAEYAALIAALEAPELLDVPSLSAIQFFLDSELVVRQVTGLYKVKDSMLKQLHATVLSLCEKLPYTISFTHVPRAQNKRADFLVNQALDVQAG